MRIDQSEASKKLTSFLLSVIGYATLHLYSVAFCLPKFMPIITEWLFLGLLKYIHEFQNCTNNAKMSTKSEFSEITLKFQLNPPKLVLYYHWMECNSNSAFIKKFIHSFSKILYIVIELLGSCLVFTYLIKSFICLFNFFL